MAEAVQKYLEEYAIPNTRGHRETARILNKELVAVMGSVPINTVQAEQVRDIVSGIKERGADLQANRTLSWIKALWSWLMANGYAESSPAIRLKAPSHETQRDRVLSDQEIVWFWNGCDDAVNGTGVAGTAMRIFAGFVLFLCLAGQAVAFQWGDVIEGQARVIDGDTLAIGTVSVRLNGFAAPELGEPGGDEAKTFMTELTSRRNVRCSLSGKRSYKREVGTCWIGTMDLGAALTAASLARDCPSFSNGRYQNERAAGQSVLLEPMVYTKTDRRRFIGVLGADLLQESRRLSRPRVGEGNDYSFFAASFSSKSRRILEANLSGSFRASPTDSRVAMSAADILPARN